MGCPPMDYAIQARAMGAISHMAMWTLVIWQLAMDIGNWQLIGYWVLVIDN
jgi:hypothetical protein